jgi:hypothetical protein
MRNQIRAAAFAMVLGAAAIGPAAASRVADAEYDAAVQAFRAGRTSDAFGRFIELANRGDVDAARIALFMHAYGPVLYGKYWEAGSQDVAYWTSLVRNSPKAGRPIAEFQPKRYDDKVNVATVRKPAVLKDVVGERR